MNADSLPVFGNAPTDVDCVERPAAYAVIRNDKQQVAVVRANVLGRGQLWLPGGGIEEGESPEQTIVREIREELGRGAVVADRIGEAIQFFFAGDDDCFYRMTAHFFIATFDGEAEGQAEFELEWVEPGEEAGDFFFIAACLGD